MTFSLPILLGFARRVVRTSTFQLHALCNYTLTFCECPALYKNPRAPKQKKQNSFSGLARALNTVSQSLSIAQALLPAAAAQTSAAASTVSHYVKNQRIRRFNVELVRDDSSPTSESSSSPVDNVIPLGPRRPSHVFTNLALGNRMETLMATGTNAALPTTPSGTFRFSLDPTNSPCAGQHHSVVGPSTALTVGRPPPLPDHPPTPVIPIPQVRRETTGYAAGSPPTGRYSHALTAYGAGSAGTSPSQVTPGSVGGVGTHYLDAYGSGGGGGSSMGSISRATTPQRQTQLAGSVSTVSGDFRLGGLPSDRGIH